MSAWILLCIHFFAFSALAASMAKHQRDIFLQKVTATKTRTLQVIGWGLLLLSLLAIVFMEGASIGISVWLGVMTFAAIFVALTLTYAPKKLLQLNFLVLGLLLLLGVMSFLT